MKRLYFIRHGQSALNKQQMFAGHIDTPLTAKGQEQAKSAGQAAHELAIDCVLSSPLSRAHETARIAADEMLFPRDKIVVHDLLIERTYGPLEGTPWDTETDIDNQPGVETLASVLERAQKVEAHVQSLPQENILIVSHGTFGVALRAVIHGEDTFQDIDDLPNAQIIRFM